VLYQLTWVLEADPFVLLQLRGLSRDELLARLHARDSATGTRAGDATDDDAPGAAGDDVETALDAALRAARLLDLVDDPDRPVDHLF